MWKLKLEVFDRDEAANSANEVINDFKIYFGHSEHEHLIVPYICLIHKNFNELTQNPKSRTLRKDLQDQLVELNLDLLGLCLIKRKDWKS